MARDLAVSGFTYVVSDDQKRSKIGHARKPLNRRTELQVGNADRLDLIGAVRCLDPGLIEKRAHAMLSPLRKRGEWFDCSPQAALAVLRHLTTGSPSLQSVSVVIAYFDAKRSSIFDSRTWQLRQSLLAMMVLDPSIDEIELDRWAPLTLPAEEQVARFPVHVQPIYLGTMPPSGGDHG